MGYLLQAIIGKQRTLEPHASAFQHVRIVPLTQDIAIIPIIDDLLNEIGDGGETDRFEKLSPGVEKWLQRISAATPVAYIEAAYHGGTGGQSAIAWAGGSRVLGPIHSDDAINQTLRYFGVQVGNAHDEFDAVGLGHHRYTDDWIVE